MTSTMAWSLLACFLIMGSIAAAAILKSTLLCLLAGTLALVDVIAVTPEIHSGGTFAILIMIAQLVNIYLACRTIKVIVLIRKIER